MENNNNKFQKILEKLKKYRDEKIIAMPNTCEFYCKMQFKDLIKLAYCIKNVEDDEYDDLTIELYNSKEKAICSLKDRYIEDIFDEFKNHIIENEEYNLTFNDYMFDFYRSKIKIVNGIYIVSFEDELLIDENRLTELFKKYKIESKNELLDLINYLEINIDNKK